MVQSYWLKNRTLYDFTSFSNISCLRIQSGILRVFSCYVTLVYDSSSVFPCLSWPSYFGGLLVNYFLECSSVWISLLFFSWVDWGFALLGRLNSEVTFPITSGCTLIFFFKLVSGDSNLNQLAKAVPGRISYHKFIFCLCNYCIFWECQLEIWKKSFLDIWINLRNDITIIIIKRVCFLSW